MKSMMTQDVARILGKSPETVRFYERNGKLPAVRTVGGRRLFRKVDVLRFAETHPAKEAGATVSRPEKQIRQTYLEADK